MSNQFEFKDHHVRLIEASLPKEVDRKRLNLLGFVLRNWAHYELSEYEVFWNEPSAQTQARHKCLKKVTQCARKLSLALGALDVRGCSRIAFEMTNLEQRDGSSPSIARVAGFDAWQMRLDEEGDFLTQLAAAASNGIDARRGRPQNTRAYLIMMDLAAIFEWLTHKKATRQVNRIDGTETGQFFRFVAAVWPVVFHSGDDGLPAAMKNWAIARKKYGEQSALIANIRIRVRHGENIEFRNTISPM
jgi:hypothetical protein